MSQGRVHARSAVFHALSASVLPQAAAAQPDTAAEPAPLITAVVATYNEESHVAACLDGLLNQVDLPGDLEILVVDGGSTDRTVEIVRDLAAQHRSIRMVENPRRFQVYAWNLGARLARGRYVALFSAHTEYARDYLARCFEVSRRMDAANVGGVQEPIGDGVIGRAIALAMRSPFGVGNAHFRFAAREQYVDSVFGGFFDKSLLLALGGFDEDIPFNEDSEFNYRLRQAGYKIFMSMGIKVRYHVRNSLGRLARQMFRGGFWRRRTQLKLPTYVPLRVMAPPALVLATLLSLGAFAATRSPSALLPVALYALFVAAGTLYGALGAQRPLDALALPVVLPVMHFSYGAGWWVGLFVHRLNRGLNGDGHGAES